MNNSGKKGVTVYQHNNYRGWSRSFGFGSFNGRKELPNNQVSSYKIEAGFCATFFNGKRYNGKKYRVCGPT